MSLEAYPDINNFPSGSIALPDPKLQISSKVDPSVLRTEMESGRPRQRAADATAREVVGLSWAMSPAQMAVFRTWHSGTITRGADWFTINLDLDGDNTKNYEVRLIGGNYRATRPATGGHFLVRATVEIITRNLDPYP